MVSSINSIMYNLELLNEKNAKVTYSLSSGNAIQNGSDDSILYNQILTIQNSLDSYNGISELISYSSSYNSSSDSSMSSVKSATESIIAGLLQANTDTTSWTDKQTIADVIEGYKETLYSLANTSIDNQYIFSGLNTDTQPFVMDETTKKVAYVSDNSTKTLNVEKGTYANQGVNGIEAFYYEDSTASNGESITISENQIILDNSGNQWQLMDSNNDGSIDGLYLDGDLSSTSISVTDNLDDTYTFTNSTLSSLTSMNSVFDLLDEMINTLNLVDSDGNSITEDEGGNILSSLIDEINTAYDSQNIAHALVGTRTNTIERYQEIIDSKITNLTILEKEFASADLTSLAVEAQSLENTYTALYSTINRVNSLSLVNYLS
ncbi:flagellar hook-associated protein FlgL [Arcobacter arenosus]|uniref:Flagellar hook-associated protein 3 n=1 Tax=Arcobacter arenosus TaxID=2576037 RepID=A0A5R8XYA1_9BACT|nr:flagellar hook-associated protein FlgL [Arcobacter arenosus]TLP35870.1 flagellar hook-associated protein 3 [Arcobacter arenosus]